MPRMTRQLKEHQQLLTDRFLKAPFRGQRHGNYRLPVPDDALARCWGSGRDPAFPGLNLERTQCQADSDVVAGDFSTGAVRLSYEAYNAPTLGAARFAHALAKVLPTSACPHAATATRRRPNAPSGLWTPATCRCARWCACRPTAS